MDIRLKKLGFEINDLQKEYVRVENYILKPSPRRILPIPILFEAIDWQESMRRLLEITQKLQAVTDKIIEIPNTDISSLEIQLKKLLLDHVRNLSSTIGLLEDVCKEMAKKAEGKKSISWNEYNFKIEEYRNNVKQYTENAGKLQILVLDP